MRLARHRPCSVARAAGTAAGSSGGCGGLRQPAPRMAPGGCHSGGGAAASLAVVGAASSPAAAEGAQAAAMQRGLVPAAVPAAGRQWRQWRLQCSARDHGAVSSSLGMPLEDMWSIWSMGCPLASAMLHTPVPQPCAPGLASDPSHACAMALCAQVCSDFGPLVLYIARGGAIVRHKHAPAGAHLVWADKEKPQGTPPLTQRSMTEKAVRWGRVFLQTGDDMSRVFLKCGKYTRRTPQPTLSGACAGTPQPTTNGACGGTP
eukprot:114286-Chlamydomonas_euryale.AAC.9